MRSTLRTTLLLGALTGLLLFLGQIVGGTVGLVIALGLAALLNFGSYWYSDKLVLSWYGAREVDAEQAPELYALVGELAEHARMPMPRVYVVPSETPNAFATGRGPQHAAVAATTGLLEILERDELAGVLAHELSHVRHRDTLISAIAATIAGAIAMLANMAQWALIFGMGRGEDEEGGGMLGALAMMIIAPIAASLIQLAVSRSREYSADDGGAQLADPRRLASALRKLEAANEQRPMAAARAHPSSAHLFIVNPLRAGSLARLFSTHPPVGERVRRLEAMAERRAF